MPASRLSAGVDPEAFSGEMVETSVLETKSRMRVLSSQHQEVNERLIREAKQAELVASQEAEWQRDWELRREAELDRIRRKKLERRAGRLRERALTGDARFDVESDASTPVGERDREEIERAMMDEVFSRNNRQWSEAEQVRPIPHITFAHHADRPPLALSLSRMRR